MATTASAKAQSLASRKQTIRKTVVKRLGCVAILLLTALVVSACSFSDANSGNTRSQDARNQGMKATATKASDKALVVLWDKGYVIEEDEAIEQVVSNWEAQSGLAVNLSFYNSGETAPRTLRASKAGGLSPDVLFAAKSVYPVSDWEGKLADVTDVVAPLANRYTKDALQVAKVYGSKKAQNRYYAVPLDQSTTHIYYWKDLLEESGYQPTDIPTDWDGFWSFWKTLQSQLSDRYPDMRSIGLPYSVPAYDTYHVFEQVLVVYGVELLDKKGRLRLDRPEVKAGIVQSLNWYLQFYKEGYVPASAVNWLDPDNNRNFLDRNVVMTPNPTLSIPAAVRNDQDIYFNKLGTVDFPNKPDGQPLPHLVDIRQAIVFKEAPHQQAAKDFLAYLIRPDVLNTFLKASYGRYMPPSISEIKADSFWQDPADPHISTVVKTVVGGQTHPFYNALNPAYGVVMEENVWGQAIHAMAVEGVSAEAAAEAAIAQIKSIFREAS